MIVHGMAMCQYQDPFTSAEFASIDKAGSLCINGSEITVQDMTEGGILQAFFCEL